VSRAKERMRGSRILPLAIGLGAIGLAVGLWQALRIQESVHIERTITADTHYFNLELKALIQPHIRALAHMANQWEARGATPKDEWERDAAYYLVHLAGYQAIAWADATSHVRWIMPPAGNEAAINSHLVLEPEARTTLDVARAEQRIMITRPVELLQGGKGFLVVVPLLREERFEGFMVGAFRIKTLLAPLIDKISALGYSVALFDGADAIYTDEAGSPADQGRCQDTIAEFYNARWRMVVCPNSKLLAQMQSSLPGVVMSLGFIMSVMLMLMVHLAQTTRRRAVQIERAHDSLKNNLHERQQAEQALQEAHDELEKRVAQRTAQLTETNAELEQEIRERRRMEQTLRDSEQRFRSTFEQAAVGIARVAPDGRFLRINRRYCEIVGYSQQDMRRLTFQDITHPDDLNADLEYCRQVLTGEIQTYCMEKRYLRKDKRLVWVRLTVSLVHETSTEPKHFIAVVEDITNSKRTEKALFEEKERAQVTLHAIGDAVITTNAHGVLEYMNPVAQRLTGWPVAEAQNQPLSHVLTLIDEQTHTAIESPVAQCLQQREIVELANNSVVVSRRGHEYAIRASAAPILTRDGDVLGAVLVVSDVTEMRRMAMKFSYQACHDALTDLLNRREFERRLQRVLATARVQQTGHVLCYLDLDQFKVINDTCGHIAGDELLRQIGTVLQTRIRKCDTLARLGGDEFAILMEQCSLAQATRVAYSLRAAMEEFRFQWEDKAFRVGMSIGLVPINAVSQSITSVLRAADAACYTAKDAGRNRIHVYQEDDVELARRHSEMQWVARLNRALEQDLFHLSWQQILPVADHNEGGGFYEFLLRMEDINGRFAPPNAFLPAAERYNLATKVDRWVVRTIFSWLALNPKQIGNLNLCAINLSGQSLGEEEFLGFVMHEFNKTRVPPEKICFEVTETAAIANFAHATRFIHALKSLGCRFALDDFGSGWSSFAYLKSLPVDFLKIDGVFVRDIVDDPADFAMVKAMTEIGRVMGKKIVAEFAENQLILDRLREIGVDYAQGFGVARPHSIEIKGVDAPAASFPHNLLGSGQSPATS
jgi:diguanylate cyclase (GGDEF)-like protein/PAS domain S-box-containing protein